MDLSFVHFVPPGPTILDFSVELFLGIFVPKI
jgi:hypothetical protein